MVTFGRITILTILAIGMTEGIEGRTVTKTLRVDNGGEWGTWRPAEFCPAGSWASAFRLRVEEKQGGGDDTAMNAVRLICSTKTNAEVGVHISSYDGLWGDWGPISECAEEDPNTYFLTGFVLKVESPGGDDTAVNDMNMICGQPSVQGRGYLLQGQGGGQWGDWGTESLECSKGSAICGLRVRYEESQGGGDDTGLNDVEMYCCT